MGLNGCFLRSVTMVLLLAICSGKRMCTYEYIRDTYRSIILVELQSLNLTGSLHFSKAKDPCPSVKAHRILVSIYNMTQQFQCLGGKETERDLAKPVQSMELLLNCTQNLVKTAKVCPARQIRGKKRRRLKLLDIIKSLVKCWQKFQSILSQQL